MFLLGFHLFFDMSYSGTSRYDKDGHHVGDQVVVDSSARSLRFFSFSHCPADSGVVQLQM